jgi:hypothetical protein
MRGYAKNASGGCVSSALLLVTCILLHAGGLHAGLRTKDLRGRLEPKDLARQPIGSGVTIASVRYQGAEVAAGLFEGGSGIIGLEEGIILSTGRPGTVRRPGYRRPG